jgi:hypothetical protein
MTRFQLGGRALRWAMLAQDESSAQPQRVRARELITQLQRLLAQSNPFDPVRLDLRVVEPQSHNVA